MAEKKKTVLVVVAIAIAIVLVGGSFWLGTAITASGTAVASENGDGNVQNVEDVAANTDLEASNVDGSATETDVLAGRKVYLFNPYSGYALSDEEADSLVAQCMESGYEDSTFAIIATTGVDVRDPETGVTFVVQKNTDGYVNLIDGAAVYVVGGVSLGELLNGVSLDNYFCDRVVDTSYGSFDLYRSR